MCGILVTTSKKDVQSGVEELILRGPDQQDKKEVGSNVFYFNRLAIMGLSENGMQPFEYKGNTLVANAEIYNYKEIKDELSGVTYKSGSDCEVLLPLYDLEKEEMFKKLDAEFAIVLHDAKTDEIIAGRDPIGIRPLFYGYEKDTKSIMFGSEAKSIIDFVEHVYPFPPGHYYKQGKFVKYSTITDVESYSTDGMEDILVNIKEKLEKGIIKRLDSDAPMGFLLSGGLDSSLVCAVSERFFDKPIRTFSIGMEKDPIDLKYAKVVADYLGTEHYEIIIKEEEVVATLPKLIHYLETYDITTIRASMGMYLISKWINENTDIKVLMTGEISDELFGYKYTDFAPDPESFQAECKKRVEEIYMYDVLRADRTLASNSLEARVPFGDIDFASYVMRIDPKYKMNSYDMGKYLLRKAFEGDYLPESILYRDKAAFSDAVGHSLVDVLKEHAEELYTDEVFEEKIKGYAEPKPFTKESLMYREIFEKQYPKHTDMVIDYWMPNKEWEGCDVDDPSARVLSNYGDSGK